MTDYPPRTGESQGDARLASEDVREPLTDADYERAKSDMPEKVAEVPDPPEWAATPRDPERDYIARTIATIRNHRDADNCWPQWANALADEIERLEAALAEGVSALARAEERERELLSALKEEQAWDMGGVPENEWMRRAEAAEEQVARVARNVQTLNRKLIQANEAKELAEEQVAALRAALERAAKAHTLHDVRNIARAALSPSGEADA